MTSACGCEPAAPTTEHEEHTPWGRDRAVLIPVASGMFLLIGLILEWFIPGAGLVATVLFWASLLLGASQFVPGALTGLVTRGKLGIGLLMTISAIGAVLLGFVEEGRRPGLPLLHCRGA